jgi:hypothetical protein
MGEKNSAGPSESLIELRDTFKAWRAGRRRGQRIPEELWIRAAKLACDHPIAVVAEILKISPDRLERKQRAVGEVLPMDHEIRMVRVAPVQINGSSACSGKSSAALAAEVCLPTGIAIKIYSGAEAATIGALAACFGRQL